MYSRCTGEILTLERGGDVIKSTLLHINMLQLQGLKIIVMDPIFGFSYVSEARMY